MTKQNDHHLPKVSIGMPVFNGGDLLKMALDTLLAQEYKDFELIISDNASTDATEQRCRAYAAKDARITYIRRDRNYGMADNGRKVLSLARGDYVMFAAHDDQWYPQFIGECVKKLDENPKLVLVAPAVEFFSPEGTILDVPYPPLHTLGMGMRERVASIFKEINIGFNSYGMYRREILEKIDKNIDCFASDVVLLLQVMLLGEACHIPKKLFRYRFVKKTAQEHIAAVSKRAAEKHPTKLYTILTINLLRAIFNSPAPASLKRVMVSDALSIIAIKNPLWRQMLISENPAIKRFFEPDQNGCILSTEVNLVSVFAALLLPYCYTGAPFEGAIEFIDIEGFDAIASPDAMQPGPGHQEFIATLRQHLENGRIAQALSYFDEYRGSQPDTEAIRQLYGPIEMLKPAHLKKTRYNNTTARKHSKTLRILFQVRAEDWRGVEYAGMLKRILNRYGHEVTLDSAGSARLLDYDLIHAFNLCHLGEDDRIINNALLQRKPIVITAFFKNQNIFAAKAIHSVSVFREYLEKGQDPKTFDLLRKAIPIPVIAPQCTKNNTAHYATCVMASGKTEAEDIKRQFPLTNVEIIPFGSSTPDDAISADLFEKEFGVKDFILTVGALEIEENQLMLLKAMENEAIPVVIVDGGVNIQPGYAVLCKKVKRRSRTIFTGALSNEMLVSACRAARVYCALGWYELPGPTLLNAAKIGCAVVASNCGGIGDYFGALCEYADPDSPESIRKAVLCAYSKEAIKGLKEHAARYSLESAATELERMYNDVLP